MIFLLNFAETYKKNETAFLYILYTTFYAAISGGMQR